MSQPYVIDNAWDKARPLKFESGAEVAKTVVVDNTYVSLSSLSQRLVTGGSLLVEITASGLYGPYDKAASDGRESLTAGACVITRRGVDVTLGDKAVAGLYHNCVFDMSALTLYGVSNHGASLTSLKAAFPLCTFDD